MPEKMINMRQLCSVFVLEFLNFDLEVKIMNEKNKTRSRKKSYGECEDEQI